MDGGALTLQAGGVAGRSPRFLWAAGVVGAWVLAGLCMFLMIKTPLADRLGDTDDALRLVFVRDFLASADLFDLHLERLQPPAGYESHWSRLIDAGMAAIYLAAKPVLGHGNAEIFMRSVWPWLWLLPTIAGAASIAMRLGGKPAFWVALAFSTSAVIAFQQFSPGRIDHHNIQIALAVAATGALVWADTSFKAAALAGAVTGFMPAIGLENIHYLALILAMISLLYVLKPEAARNAAGFWLAFMAGAAIAFFVSVPPAQWTVTQCDAIAINLIVPLAAAGAVFLAGMAALEPGRGAGARLVVASLAGAVCVAGYVSMNPACLRGPFALVDPAIKHLWLDHVSESANLAALAARGEWPVPVAIALPCAIAIAAGAALLHFHRGRDGAFARWAALLFAAAGFAVAVLVIRMAPYAAWFALPLAAAGVAAFWHRFDIEKVWVRVLTAAAAAPFTTTFVSLVALPSVFPAVDRGESILLAGECFNRPSYGALAALPKGRVAAPVDFGPFVLAFTQHDVLAAPYHRLTFGIFDTFEILTNPSASEAALARNGIDYVMLCETGSSRDSVGPLVDTLRKGEAPAYLEQVAETKGKPLLVFRVKK
jgi:hypothetical protein